MPNRVIKESSRTSLSLSQLSHGAERLWWRLLTCADDFGRVQADPQLVQAACFPRQLLTIHVADVRTFLEELVAADMLVMYTHNGNQYAYFKNWDKHNKKRAKYSKYPSPNGDMSGHSCEQMPADANIRKHMHASADLIENREARYENRESRSETAIAPQSKDSKGSLDAFHEQQAQAEKLEAMKHGWQDAFKDRRGPDRPVDATSAKMLELMKVRNPDIGKGEAS